MLGTEYFITRYAHLDYKKRGSEKIKNIWNIDIVKDRQDYVDRQSEKWKGSEESREKRKFSKEL